MTVSVAIAVRNKPSHAHYPAGLPATTDPHFAATGLRFHVCDDELRRDQWLHACAPWILGHDSPEKEYFDFP